MSDAFSFKVKGHQFNPRFKAGIWDGTIRMINSRNSTMPKGLVPNLIKKSVDMGYKCAFAHGFIDRFHEEVPLPLEQWNLAHQPRDYQEEAVRRCITKKRQIILSPTGSGKSLIVYLIARALQDVIDDKILIMVPRVGLVTQILGDFKDYAVNDSWDADENTHTIYSGQDKDTKKQIVISTWQSLQKLPAKYFEQFGAVLGDEVHEYEAKVGSMVLEKCVNAFYRLGFSGTLKDAKTHELALTGSFGPIYQVTTTKELMDRNILSNLDITAIVLKYKDIGGLTAKTKYQEEVDWIIQHEARLKFVVNLTKATSGNTLVLFNFVEKHGKPLHEMMKKMCPDKEIHFIYGGTEADQRERVRKIAEQRENVVILASYGTYSTGVNIVNLKNIILASPTKSKVRLLQSIGRGLRRSATKELCRLFDVADDLRGTRKKSNYTLKHFKERYDTYLAEGFNVKIKTINI